MPEHSEEFERPEPAPYDELSEDDVMALQAENERLRKALELACEDGWDDGQWAMRRYLEMAQASLSGSSEASDG